MCSANRQRQGDRPHAFHRQFQLGLQLEDGGKMFARKTVDVCRQRFQLVDDTLGCGLIVHHRIRVTAFGMTAEWRSVHMAPFVAASACEQSPDRCAHETSAWQMAAVIR